jgi:hypothetical protein
LTRGSFTPSGALNFTSTPLRIQGAVLVETERFGQFEISLDEVIVADLTGRVLDRRGQVDLGLANTVALELDIPRAELPQQARAMSLVLRMHPGSLRLTGRLRQLEEIPARQSRSQVFALPTPRGPQLAERAPSD